MKFNDDTFIHYLPMRDWDSMILSKIEEYLECTAQLFDEELGIKADYVEGHLILIITPWEEQFMSAVQEMIVDNVRKFQERLGQVICSQVFVESES